MIADLSLYLVTDPGLCGERGVVETVRLAVDGGVRIVQLRDKIATDAETADQLVELSRVIAGRAILLVNDRVDAALAVPTSQEMLTARVGCCGVKVSVLAIALPGPIAPRTSTPSSGSMVPVALVALAWVKSTIR